MRFLHDPSFSDPFTRADARAAGVSDDDLAGPHYRRLFHGVHIRAGAPITAVTMARAALLRSPPDAIIGGRAAARLWGGVVPDGGPVDVLHEQGHQTRAVGLRSHPLRRMPRTRIREGIRVTTPERTFADLAAELDLVDLVVLGDSLVRRRVTTPTRLREEAPTGRGARARLARRAAGLVRSGVDSPQETRLRLLMVLAGLPEPTVNHIILSDSGRWAFRFDLAFEEHKLIIEYDGRQHAEDDKQWLHDLRRREELDDLGWRILVVIGADLYRPAATLRRICGVLEQAGLPSRITKDEWRRHFALPRVDDEFGTPDVPNSAEGGRQPRGRDT